MAFNDFVDQFENFNFAYFPSEDKDHRAIGTLVPGKNAGEQLKDSLQYSLEVGKEQDVWIQALQEQNNPKAHDTK